MQLQKPFAVVTSAVDGDVLRVLASARRSFTTGELARLIPDRSVDGVRRAAGRLVEQGVVDRAWAGRVAAYSLNREHLAAPAIMELAALRTALLQRLRDVTGVWVSTPRFGAIFGSAARGAMRSDSDLDIFLVRPHDADSDGWDADVAVLAEKVTSWTGNDARIIDEDEFDLAPTPLLQAISDEGIPFVGAQDWLVRALRGRPAHATT